MSILDTVTSSYVLGLASLAALVLSFFGVEVVEGHDQVALGLALYVASKVVDD